MNIWLWADLHFDHINILKYENRPFADHLSMTEQLIKNYEETVAEGDLVFWLGDIFFCNTARMMEISKRLQKTRNILIRGNHDKRVSDAKFKRLGFYPYRMYEYRDYLLTHEPVSDINMNHLLFVGVKGNIHGHVHSNIDKLNPKTHQCVSVEVTNYRPILFEEVVKRFEEANRKE